MPKKITPLSDFISAGDAAQLLSAKLGRPIGSKYIRSLSKSKKQNIRIEHMGNRILYNRSDILAANIKQKRHNSTS